MLRVGPVIGLIVAGVFTYGMPRMYESEALIEVRPERLSGGGCWFGGSWGFADVCAKYLGKLLKNDFCK
jgi:hypothetical protein